MPVVLWNQWAGKGIVQFRSSAGCFMGNSDILSGCLSCSKAGTWTRKLMQADFQPRFRQGKSKVCTLLGGFYGTKTR